jgi:hypothetical protein
VENPLQIDYNLSIIFLNDYAVSPTNWGDHKHESLIRFIVGEDNLMQCPNCQHWNEAGSRFCEECGFELPTTNGGNYQVPVRDASAPPSSAAVVQPVPQQAEAIPDIPAQNLTPIDDPAPVA